MTELKPCPFCGNKKVHLKKTQEAAWVTCRECGTDGPFVEKEHFDYPKDTAIELWNKRVEGE